jgi:hypothetical protein
MRETITALDRNQLPMIAWKATQRKEEEANNSKPMLSAKGAQPKWSQKDRSS